MTWLTIPPASTCDWGDCEQVSIGWRISAECGWLPVCWAHKNWVYYLS